MKQILKNYKFNYIYIDIDTNTWKAKLQVL